MSLKTLVLVGLFYIIMGVGAYQIEGVRTRINDVVYSSFNFENDLDANQNRNMDGVEFRLAKWYFSCLAILNKGDFIFGVGTGDGQKTLDEVYKENNFVIGYVDHFNSHNQFLTSTLELGIVGLISYLSIFVVAILKGLKARNMILVFVCFLILFFSTTESILTRQKGVLLITFFLPFTKSLVIVKEEDLQVNH